MLASLALATLTQTSEMRLMRFPTIHGESVVFTYAGDLWSVNRDGGLARRLTSHPGTEQYARFSPDGKWIAFTGAYDGNADVYLIPTEGGDPVRLTYDPTPDIVRGWTPDGQIAYISPGTTPGGFTAGLRFVSPKGGMPVSTKLSEVSDVSFSPDGKTIAFNRNNSHNFNWRRYRGGTQGRIGFSDVNGSFYKEIPSGKENRWLPMYAGGSLFYIGDKTLGTRNLWKYDPGTGKESQVTNFADADIKWPSTDGNTIVYERDGFLETFDVKTGKVDRLNCRIAGDLNYARPKMMEYGAQVDNYSISPTGSRVAVAARGEIFSVPARTGDTRHFGGDSSSREFSPSWSPDGNTIAFMSDKSGEDRIYTMPQMGGDWTEVATPKDLKITNFGWSPNGKMLGFGTTANDFYIFDLDSKKATKVLSSEFGMNSADWSPDSNWIAYVNTGPNLAGATFLYNIKEAKTYQITDGYYTDTGVAFDQNGKFLYLISQRVFNPTPSDFEFQINMTDSQRVYVIPLAADTPNPMARPGDEEPGTPPPAAAPAAPPAAPPAEAPKEAKGIKVDIEGMAARALPLPWGPGNYSMPIGINNGVMVMHAGTLAMFDFASRQAMDLFGPVFAVDVNAKRSKMGVLLPGGAISILDIRPGVDPNSGRVNLNNCELVNDPRAEWKQMFWQAWRWERDRFYDKDMLGLDWNAIGKQYEKYLPYVAHRSDLNYVLSNMLSELGTGHSYVSGGDMGGGAAAVPSGMLGADYELDKGKIRFKKIYKGLNFEEGRRGPLGEPGMKVSEGDYLLQIDGKDVNDRNPAEFLVNKVGRTVNLLVNDKPDKVGARKLVVRPIAGEGELRYIEWVESRRKLVAEWSGGKIGYLHVPDTSIGGMTEFAKGFYTQSDKQGLIVDERFNGGGMIPTFFIEKLSRTYTSMFRQRNGGDIGFPPQTLDMPKAMLVNEYAGSGGDLFPYLFKKAGLGPLIGNRTWGGLVGITGNAPLTDGGGVTAPEFGLYDPDTGKWIAENTGISPDIAVDNSPNVIASGEDAQLRKAVDYLLDQIKKGRKPVKRPEFPRVKVGG